MLGRVRWIAAVAAAASLGIAPSAAAPAPAAKIAVPAPKAIGPVSAADPWLTLSIMTASTSSASAAAAQEEEQEVGWPHAAPLSVVLGTIATGIYILLDEDQDPGIDPETGKRRPSPILRALGLRPTPLSPA